MTSNVRFVFTNLADTAATLTATSTAGSLAASNMLIDERDAVWRSNGAGSPPITEPQIIDMRWATAQSIDSICGAWTNLTSGASIECKGYTNVGDMVAVFDETVSADTALSLGNTTFQNWIPAAHGIKQLKIIITDVANPDGYVQISRLVVGLRFEPVTNADSNGFAPGLMAQRKPDRAESFDLRVDLGRTCRNLALPLSELEPASRDQIVNMAANGLGQGVWVSALPESSDASTRQLHGFWGALVSDTSFRYPMYNTWAATLMFQEMG